MTIDLNNPRTYAATHLRELVATLTFDSRYMPQAQKLIVGGDQKYIADFSEGFAAGLRYAAGEARRRAIKLVGAEDVPE